MLCDVARRSHAGACDASKQGNGKVCSARRRWPCAGVGQVRQAEGFERFWAKRATASLCVTQAMQRELALIWDVQATVFHDQPPAHFQRSTLEVWLALTHTTRSCFPAAFSGPALKMHERPCNCPDEALEQDQSPGVMQPC